MRSLPARLAPGSDIRETIPAQIALLPPRLLQHQQQQQQQQQQQLPPFIVSLCSVTAKVKERALARDVLTLHAGFALSRGTSSQLT
eukprot:4775920-Pyramimonas_sp.AAC.1